MADSESRRKFADDLLLKFERQNEVTSKNAAGKTVMRTLVMVQTIVVVVVATAILAAPASRATATGQNESVLPACYVLGIGIDKLEDSKADFTGSPCVNDVNNIVHRLKAQEKKVYDPVQSKALLDKDATIQRIAKGIRWLGTQGKAGDFLVLVLSGHNAMVDGKWCFVSHDLDALGEAEILAFTDKQAGQGKIIWLVVDSCKAGHLRIGARALMVRHRNPQRGGLIVSTSSMGSQGSAALGNYSAYAQALSEGLGGGADLDGDGIITLGELRRYSFHRCHEIVRHARQPEQDGEIDWSLSLSENLKLAVSPVKNVSKPR